MTIQNLRPRVISMARPTAPDSTASGHVFLVPGLNTVSDEDAKWLAEHPGIKRRVKAGELKILDGSDDPLSGSVEKVVTGVADTFDRPTLDALRARDKRPKVRDAIDEQLAKLTDHRSKGAA